MEKHKLLVYPVLIITLSSLNCNSVQNELIVKFPNVSEALAITSGPREHLFASYYGINSWSEDQRYVTVLETSIKYRLPTENDPATLGLVDLVTNEFIPLTETHAWNFQQGCMAHWLGTYPNSRIIYNDLVDGKYVSIIIDVHTKEKIRIIPHPVAAVSPNGKEAISINFSRLRTTRESYGYGGEGQDAQLSVQFPKDDGLFLIDLETGKAELLVSINDVKEKVPEVPDGGIGYFNHVLFSREGGRIFWLSRAIPNRNTTAFTVNRDGKNLQRCFPDGWGGSHFDWLNEDELMITGLYKAESNAHILFTPGQENYRRLGNGLLDYDGHGTFSPDGKWMVTDTYPGNKGLYEQKLYLMDMKTEAVLPMGRYVHPLEFRDNGKDAQCDLHPRWSPKGDMIGYNSVTTGERQVYIIKLK
ncbi:TolB family protein [Bacteroidota bacterium]